MQKYLVYFLLLFTIVTGFYFWYGYSQLDGSQYVYPMDDVYIHLAIARNFAEHGFWSINLNSFDSASSSILYTLLLSLLIKVFGDSIYYPLIINIFCGYFSVYWLYKYFRDFYSKKELKIGLVLFLPVPLLYLMVLLGMEHTLHIWLTVMAVYYIHKNIDSDFSKKDLGVLILILFFTGMVRFESMFLTIMLAFTVCIRKKNIAAFMILTAGFLPIIIFGLVSVKCGGYFFPNSVIIKGSYPGGSIFASIWQILKNGILLNGAFYKLFLFPFLCIGIYLWDTYKGKSILDFLKNETLIIVVAGVALLQSLFGVIKFRYENYIMMALLMILIPIAASFYKKEKLRTVSQMLFLFSFLMFSLIGFYRVFYHHHVLKMASKNISEQQIQMSRFLNIFYKNQKIVANDIGAIAYFGNVQLFDIVGLGSTDVAEFKIQYKNTPKELYDKKSHEFLSQYILKNNYKIGVIYPTWFPGEIPSYWIPVASWTIKDNKGTAMDKVVWYAFSSKEAGILRRNRNKNVVQQFYSYK